MKRLAPWGAFTLIELLIVVAIIAILALIAVPNFLEAAARAKVSREKTELRQIDVALTAYHVDNNEWPPWREFGSNLIPCSRRFHRLTSPIAYITSIPKDPYAINRELENPYQGGPRWDTYDYVNYIDGDWDGPTLYGHWWRVNGFGPDYYNQFAGGRGSWDGISPDAFDVFPNYIYDPTNGTVSWGDVVRVGPRCGVSQYPYHPIETLPW